VIKAQQAINNLTFVDALRFSNAADTTQVIAGPLQLSQALYYSGSGGIYLSSA
jgi:hypothetical protein